MGRSVELNQESQDSSLRARELISSWYGMYAPGLPMQHIPDTAKVILSDEKLIPFGLSYRLEMPDGCTYPRYQSGPGVTVAVTDGAGVAFVREFRPETDRKILKCVGGFAGNNLEAAKDIVSIYNRIKPGEVIAARETHPSLMLHLDQIFRREFPGFTLNGRSVHFVDKPVGFSNIRICSVMGYLRIQPEEFKAVQGGQSEGKVEIAQLLQANGFDDANTHQLMEYLLDSVLR
jgi:hypothetical protein